MSVKATSTFDPPNSQVVLQFTSLPDTTERVVSLMSKGAELLGYINSLSLKTQHQIIPITECVSLENSSFEKFYAQYKTKYLYFCEIAQDLAKNRVALAVESSKKGVHSDEAIHSAVALNGKVAGAFEMCSLVAMQALKIGLYPMIISLGRDVKPLDDEPQHDVVIVFDEEIDVKETELLRKRMGNNFYCVMKQLHLSIIIDPTLELLVISKDLESNIAYKKQIASIKATKIYKMIIVKSPYDRLKSFVDQLLEDTNLLEENKGWVFQPYARDVREKWCELVLKQMEIIFKDSCIVWARDTGAFGVFCQVDIDSIDVVTEQLSKMQIAFSISNKSDDKKVFISCLEMKEWRILHEILEDNIVTDL